MEYLEVLFILFCIILVILGFFIVYTIVTMCNGNEMMDPKIIMDINDVGDSVIMMDLPEI